MCNKTYDTTIAEHKRRSYWLGVELRQVQRLIDAKKQRITLRIEQINEAKCNGRHDSIKMHERWKRQLIKELDVFISLQVRLNDERGELGRLILSLRHPKVNANK